jgi:hypothetical protein
MCVGQIPEHVGEIDSGMAIGYFNMPPSLQWSDHDLILVRAPFFGDHGAVLALALQLLFSCCC